MTTIAIPLSDERLEQLRLRAEQAGLAPEEFLRRRVEQLLDRPDEPFRQERNSGGISMAAFADTDELIQFARAFLRERTDSLQRDVQVCIHGATAAFSAILYCLSTIDLLGAVLGGDAESPTGVSARAKEYASRFMHYSADQRELLWSVFRHKLVHLAQPNPVKEFKKKKTTWGYWHDDGGHHLKLVPLDPPVRESRASGLSIEAEQRFEISIRHLVVDIVDSVHAPGGYLHTLASDTDLQDKFTKAMREIHKP